jgi:predicted phosphodiesterase
VRLGVFSDVHGNRTALEAVVADGHVQRVDCWWVLGDLVAIGPEPVGTLELLANLPDTAIISGNTERYVLTGDRPPPTREDVLAETGLLSLFAAVHGSFTWTRGALAATGWLGWLSALGPVIRADLPDGARILGVHASPGCDDGEGITPHRSELELAASLAGVGADIVCAGHTHQPTDRVVGSVRALNCGSVSNPITDDLRASYLIVHADRHGHAVEHRRVSYDHDKFLAVLEASGHPEADYIASFQRGDQIRHVSERSGPKRWSSGAPTWPCAPSGG